MFRADLAHPYRELTAMNRRMLATRRRRLAKSNCRRRPQIEPLEARNLLTVFLENNVLWNDQGPRPIEQAQLSVPPDDDAGGAVQSIAVNPSDPTNIMVGTVNGGVWETNNANPAAPGGVTWTPAHRSVWLVGDRRSRFQSTGLQHGLCRDRPVQQWF